MVTPCRISPPGSIHMVTRRVSQGEFLLRPDPFINQSIMFSLAYTSEKHAIEIHQASVLSNHVHLLCTDTLGDRLQEFTRDFFSLTARCINSYRGRRENLWAPDRPNCVMVAPREVDLVNSTSYLGVNPVESELVSHGHKWPGVLFRISEIGRREFRVDRPKWFFDPSGSLPDSVTLRLTMPKAIDATEDQLRLRISQEVNRREEAVRDRVRREGRSFLGAKRVLRKSVRSRPRQEPDRGDVIPSVACKDTRLRIAMLQWKKARQAEYDRLRRELVEGALSKDCVRLPKGTYGLWRWYGFAREPWEGCLWRQLIAGLT